MKEYAELLSSRSFKIGVWGAGYIGYSTMAHFARSGVSGIAVDVIPEKVEAFNRGESGIFGLREWLRIEVEPLARAGLMQATLDYERLLLPDVLVHFVCIPTEKGNQPYNQHLVDVITKLAGAKQASEERPPLIIIESTLTPGTTDTVIIPILEAHGKKIGRDILLGVAPRRDWFVDDTKSLKELDRIFGGYDYRSSQAIQQVLGIICDHLHAASSHRTAEMVKSFENAYRHMEITLANQLSLAFPGEDIRETLRLAGTKWNINTYYPGFGTGGYCIPLSSRYVIAGAERPEELTLLADTIETDSHINRMIAQSMVARGLKTVGVLGLSYKANLKVSVLSPTLPFVEEMLSNGIKVKLCDPLYSAQEIQDLAGVPSFDFPVGLQEFDGVIAIVNHNHFSQCLDEIPGHLSSCKFILDNHGIWSGLKAQFYAQGIDYHISGDANWLQNTSVAG